MRLDLGGIGKGYAADEALAVLRRHGIRRALVAASGDIAIGDPPPGRSGWHIAVGTAEQHTEPTDGGKPAATRFNPAPATRSESAPAAPGQSAPATRAAAAPDTPPATAPPAEQRPLLLLANCGVSTSGDANQFVVIDGRRYSHIVDPRTGLGLTTPMSATVIARDAVTADSLATAVCTLSPREGLALCAKYDGAEVLIVRAAQDGAATSAGKGAGAGTSAGRGAGTGADAGARRVERQLSPGFARFWLK
jgi:thiamine biosynthesis lipoprotein